MSKITVFTARRVVTMDPGRPVAEAIAVMDGKVVSTGTIETMKPGCRGTSTRSIARSKARSSCRASSTRIRISRCPRAT